MFLSLSPSVLSLPLSLPADSQSLNESLGLLQRAAGFSSTSPSSSSTSPLFPTSCSGFCAGESLGQQTWRFSGPEQVRGGRNGRRFPGEMRKRSEPGAEWHEGFSSWYETLGNAALDVSLGSGSMCIMHVSWHTAFSGCNFSLSGFLRNFFWERRTLQEHHSHWLVCVCVRKSGTEPFTALRGRIGVIPGVWH